MSKVSGFLASMPAFDQMVKAQKQVIERAELEAQAEAQQKQEEALRNTKLQACVDAAYLIASADGASSKEELAHIANKMSEITNGEVSGDQAGKMLGIAQSKVDASGREALVGKIASTVQSSEERETAFAVAAAVSWTGGGIGVKEGLALQALSKAFGWEMNHMHQLLGKARG
jgi:tellurite resistance protein